MEQLIITADKLDVDPANVRRRTDQDSLASLKASILAHGIAQPLAARRAEGETFLATGGGRRLRAVRELIAEGKVAADFPIPIIVRDVDDRTAREISLAENVLRRDMRPVDDFRAFTELADEGLSVADIALRFGQSERFVRGRLALGKLHPEILEAFDNGELSFEAATAYTVNPDTEAQIQFFRSGHWQSTNAHYIRHAMAGDGLRGDSNLAKFIGEDRYRDAGGEIAEDLFGTESIWKSLDVIEQLKAKRLDEFRAEMIADGWSFAETIEEYGAEYSYQVRKTMPEGTGLSEEEIARLEEISEILEGEGEFDDYDALSAEYDELDARSAAFTPEQKERSGVVLDTQRFEIIYGAIRREEPKTSSASAGVEKPKKDPLALSQPTKDMLGEVATKALVDAVQKNADLALTMLAAMLSIADVSVHGVAKPSRIEVKRIDYAAREAKSRTYKAEFERFAKLKPAALKKELAELIASTVDLREHWFYKEGVGDDHRTALRLDCFRAFGVDPTAHFDAQAFFDLCNKPVIDQAMREMTGFPCAKPKKADMAREAAEKAKETGWLPKELRGSGYKGPKSKGAEKNQAAA